MTIVLCILVYILIASGLNFLIYANTDWGIGYYYIYPWIFLAWIFPIGIPIYILRLVILCPKLLYDYFHNGVAWEEYFLPWRG